MYSLSLSIISHHVSQLHQREGNIDDCTPAIVTIHTHTLAPDLHLKGTFCCLAV